MPNDRPLFLNLYVRCRPETPVRPYPLSEAPRYLWAGPRDRQRIFCSSDPTAGRPAKRDNGTHAQVHLTTSDITSIIIVVSSQPK
ncbi:hypothetical protein ACOMHN_045720 [Nucella lapillus]